MASDGLTLARLRELLFYDEETGFFMWRVSRPKCRAGAVAGGLTDHGYWCVGLDGVLYQAHRLVWFYVYGSWPLDQIDHRNGVRWFNVLDNLRDATNGSNQENQHRAQSTNKSGFLGVSTHRDGKFQARIQVNGVDVYLGLFTTPQLAHAAYLKAKRKHHRACVI